MKKFNLIAVFLIFSSQIWAQVPKTVVVEHFTNSRCGICASRNPGFYTNLNNQTGVIHISYHPSAPYSNCFIHNLNATQNDARTNYYGVYGATPRFVIQGENKSGNSSDQSFFDPYLNETSEASIRVEQVKFGNDSMRVTVIIKTEASHSYGNLRLFAGLAEDTLSYEAPNGEDLHFDVFRRSLSNIEGDAFTLPSNTGDSVVLSFSAINDDAWNWLRLFSLVILQDEDTKEVIQAAKAESDQAGTPVGIDLAESQNLEFSIFPNPVSSELTIQSSEEINSIQVFNTLGSMVYDNSNLNDQLRIDVSDWVEGVHFIRIETGGETLTRRIIVN